MSTRFSRRSGFVLATLLGSLCVYCTQLTGSSDPTKNANADGSTTSACCAQKPYAFTTVTSATLAGGATSAPIDVSGYQEVVIYASGQITCTSNNDVTHVGAKMLFRPDANTPFGSTGVNTLTNSGGSTYGTRLRVDGSDLELVADACATGYASSGSIAYTVAGVALN